MSALTPDDPITVVKAREVRAAQQAVLNAKHDAVLKRYYSLVAELVGAMGSTLLRGMPFPVTFFLNDEERKIYPLEVWLAVGREMSTQFRVRIHYIAHTDHYLHRSKMVFTEKTTPEGQSDYAEVERSVSF